MKSLGQLVAECLLDIRTRKVEDSTGYATWNHEDVQVYAGFLASMSAMSRGDVIEVGTDTGLGTMALAFGKMLANRGERVYSLEIIQERVSIARNRLDSAGLHEYASIYQGCLSDVGELPTAGLVYIDGDHGYAGCRLDLEHAAKLLAPAGYLLLHDVATPGEPGFLDHPISEWGVYHALAEFLNTHGDFECVMLGNSFAVASRKHPRARGWVVTEQEIVDGR